jgi:signal transduction histidine kinase
VGFDSSVVSYSGDSKSGHGLQNIKARVKAVDGKFFFRSSPGRGFQVLIRIPVLHKEKN